MKRITWVECPGCKTYSDQKVVRSDRNSKHIIIRRRECYECGHRWETIQYPEMIVSKQQAAYSRCEWFFWYCLICLISFSFSKNKRNLYNNLFFIGGVCSTANFASSSSIRIIEVDSTVSVLAWFFIISMQKAFNLSISSQPITSLHLISTANCVSIGSGVEINLIKLSFFMLLERCSRSWEHSGFYKSNCLIVYWVICLLGYCF